MNAEDRKEVAKKKLKKAIPHTEEAAIAAAKMLVAQVEIEKEKAEWVKPIEDYTPTDFALVNDPPEPGVADVSVTPAGANVVRRGFTTIQMAQAYRNGLKNKEEYYVVEVREGNGLMVDGPILCHYVVRKGEEL